MEYYYDKKLRRLRHVVSLVRRVLPEIDSRE